MMMRMNHDARRRSASVGWVMPKVLMNAFANASRIRMYVLYESGATLWLATFSSPGHQKYCVKIGLLTARPAHRLV